MRHSGVDKQTVADLAGHGDTTFLERTYCHPQIILKQKAAVALSNTIFGGSAYVDEQADSFENEVKQRQAQAITVLEFAERWLDEQAMIFEIFMQSSAL